MPAHDVLGESADEGVGVKAHDLRGVSVGAFFVSEGDGVVVDVNEAVVADHDLVGGAREGAQYLLWATEWWLRVDDPFHRSRVIEATFKLVVGDTFESAPSKLVEHLAAKYL